MKFEYLKEFAALAEIKNYSACADSLFITQPTLTRHIQEIESELGTTLFERNSRGITLSRSGEILLPYAKDAVKLQREYTEAIEQYLRIMNGSVSIGTIHAIEQYKINRIMNRWTRERPDMKLKIVENDSAELVLLLRQGVIDFAFIREDYPDDNADFERINIGTDNLVCVVPESHPLARRSSVNLQELCNERFIYYEVCQLIRNLFWSAGFNPKAGLTGAKGRNALLQVRQGLGIMLNFRKPIDDSELDGVSILNIEPKVTSSINLVYRSRNIPEAGKKFIRCVKSAVSDDPEFSAVPE